MRLRSRQGKVARGLLVRVSVSRVLGAHTWYGGESSARVSRRLRWHDIEHVRIRAHAHAAIGVHDIIRNKDSPLVVLSTFPLDWRGGVWFMWEHEIVWRSCEKFVGPGEVSRKASAQNSDREKETRIRAISFHHALTSLECFPVL